MNFKKHLFKIYKKSKGLALAAQHAVEFLLCSQDKETGLWRLRFPNLLLPAVIAVDPAKVAYRCSTSSKPSQGCDVVTHEDIDGLKVSVRDLSNSDVKFVSCRLIVQTDVDLRETPEFKYIVQKIADNGQYRRCVNEEDVFRYMLGRKALYLSMKDGYKSQPQLGGSRYLDEVQAALDSEGNLLQMNGGNHRFAAAYYLGIKQVPVHLAVMHAQLFKGQHHKNRFEFLRAVRQKIKDVEARYA